MAFHPIAALREKIASLQERWRDVRQENERLRKEIEDLRQDRERLKQEKERLRQEQDRLRQEQERLRRENDRLKRQLEEAQRANKRQAAPFSRRQRKENPKKPGRKRGSGYGQRYSKAIPDRVDEVIAVPAPRQCECGGELEVSK